MSYWNANTIKGNSVYPGTRISALNYSKSNKFTVIVMKKAPEKEFISGIVEPSSCINETESDIEIMKTMVK